MRSERKRELDNIWELKSQSQRKGAARAEARGI